MSPARDGSADVAAFGVAPDEAGLGGHLVDDRVTRDTSVRPGITALGFAAADMAAGSAQAQVPGAAALLASIGLGRCGRRRNVLARGGARRVDETAK